MSEDLDDLLAKLTPEEHAHLLARLTADTQRGGDSITGDKIGGDKVGGDKVVEPQGTLNVGDNARISGPTVGLNLGTIIARRGRPALPGGR